MKYMLSIAEIRAFPTVTGTVMEAHPDFDTDKLHESLFRSFQILSRVKWLLREGASNAVVQQEIEEMELPPNLLEIELKDRK